MHKTLQRLHARVKYEWGSAVLPHVPVLGPRMIGKNPVRWWLARPSVSDLPPENWHEAPGNSDSGRVPEDYLSRIVLSGERARLQQMIDPNSHPAIKLAAAFNEPGKEPVIVTPLSAEALARDGEQLHVMFGIGQGGLRTTVVTYDTGTRFCWPVNTPLQAEIVNSEGAGPDLIDARTIAMQRFPGVISV